jgi:hypothetical protein
MVQMKRYSNGLTGPRYPQQVRTDPLRYFAGAKVDSTLLCQALLLRCQPVDHFSIRLSVLADGSCTLKRGSTRRWPAQGLGSIRVIRIGIQQRRDIWQRSRAASMVTPRVVFCQWTPVCWIVHKQHD